jgi:hypothetical protein
MRMIPVSTDVFAAIWKEQKPGEDSEDTILRRMLNIPPLQTPHPPNPGPNLPPVVGFVDGRSGVSFPAGFEIFRAYHGREYRARAFEGAWLRSDNGSRYKSINQLSLSLGVTENAWDAWYYIDESDGERKPIGRLRSSDRVHHRLARSTDLRPEQVF